MKPTLILLPGLDGTGTLFGPFAAAARSGVSAAIVSYPSNVAAYDELEKIARDQLADNCVILAESFSGPLGVRLAADPRVRALILCNTFVSPPRWPYWRFLLVAPLFSVPPPRWLLRRLLLGDSAPSTIVDEVQETIRNLPALTIARRLGQVLTCDERETLSHLTTPVLYLRSLSDVLVTERTWKEIKRLQPNAQIAEMSGPHLLLQVEPRACWEAIMPFLSAAGISVE